MATTKRWTRWSKWGGSVLANIGGDERTVVSIARSYPRMGSQDPVFWTVARMVRAPEKALGAKLQEVESGEEPTVEAARKAAEAWLEKESIADWMLSQNAASKKNGGVPFWSDEDLVRALENEGASHSDATAAVEGAKKAPRGGWLTADLPADAIRTDEEQAAIDRVELRDEPIGGRYPLLSRIASGEQAKIDAEIDRFDRRNEQERPFVPAWRRRELERLERGETAGKDLGIAEELPTYEILERVDIEWTALFQGEPLGLVFSSREEVEEYVVGGIRAGNAAADYEIVSRTKKTETTAWAAPIQDPDVEECARIGHPGGYGEDPVVCLRCGQAIEKPRRHSVAGLQAAHARVADDSAASAEVLELAIELDVSLFEAAEIRRARAARQMGVSPLEAARMTAAAEQRYAETGLTGDAEKAVEAREAEKDVAWIEQERARLGPDAELPEHWGPAEIRAARKAAEEVEASRRAADAALRDDLR